MTKRLLFLCTGNYYRSRYAELLFNALAPAAGLDWRADSRGLDLAAGHNNVGPLSPFVLQRLKRSGIEPSPSLRFPREAVTSDFSAADLVIALKRSEHLPMMQAKFREWAGRIECWQVDDIDVAPPAVALGLIDTQVNKLLARLASNAGS